MDYRWSIDGVSYEEQVNYFGRYAVLILVKSIQNRA